MRVAVDRVKDLAAWRNGQPIAHASRLQASDRRSSGDHARRVFLVEWEVRGASAGSGPDGGWAARLREPPQSLPPP
ncbi:MAG TPA: hypothetical protein VMQ99_17150, partial [Acetobacteraceae bacterium]|nr:hypothetical protein [Acetobacteraceae bacterium]